MDPYDRLFYDGICIPETHPETLAALGHLFGLPAVEPAACRVLELGCATGANLIPMAVGLPGASLLGIDRSGPQIEAGRRLAAPLGLANLELRQGDILDLDPETLGPFDYVIAHGVYSWVPQPVRERLLWLGRRLLAPGGIFYASYNCLPGWRLRAALRDILRDACRDRIDPGDRLAAAGLALDRLAAGLADLPGEAARLLRGEIRRVRAAPASYLYFEYLDEHNEPVLFRDFARSCAAAGLRYLCDSRLHTLFPASLGEGVEQALADLSDGLELEQWLDFLADRGFRQSLLIRDDAWDKTGGRAGEEPGISLERFAGLSLGADLIVPARLRLGDRRAVGFAPPTGGTDGDGAAETLEVRHPLTKAVLAALAERYPDCVPLTEVFPAARARVRQAGAAADGDQVDEALAELFGLFARGALQARLRPRRVPPARPGPPRATALARVLVGAGRTALPTRDHANLELDGACARLIGYLDGTRDRAELARCLGADLGRAPGLDPGRGPGTRARPPRPGGAPARTDPMARLVDGLIGRLDRYGLIETESGSP